MPTITPRTVAGPETTQIFDGTHRHGHTDRAGIERLQSGTYLVVDSEEQVEVHRLEPGITHIGRGVSSDIRVEDHTVSARHAIVTTSDDGGVRLLDDRSTNGTFVNDARIVSQDLKSGDRIAVGKMALSFLVVR